MALHVLRIFTRATLYASGPVSVRLSVTSRSSIDTFGRIELVFGITASFDLYSTLF